VTRDPTQYVFWLTSRAAGVTAFALASGAVIAGLMMAGKLSAKPGQGRILKAAHEHMAVGTLIAVAIHGLALLGDHWLNPGLGGLLVPFAMDYRPVATGLGILAGYGMALLGLTFYARRRIGARLWRKAHRFTIVFWALAAVHTLAAGSDASTPWMRAIFGLSVAPVVVLFIARTTGGKRRPAPRHAPAGATTT
jgi:sulfoxide reductase heme-binding subunit YedZ